MKRKWARSLIQYGAALGVGLCISALTAWHQGFAWAQPLALNARYLSDGCFVAGGAAGGHRGTGDGAPARAFRHFFHMR